MKCPNGHNLPHAENGVDCITSACGADAKPLVAGQKIQPPRKQREKIELPIPHGEINRDINKTNKALLKEEKEVMTDNLEQESLEQLEKMRKAIGKYHARKAWLKPADTSKMTPEESKDYVQKKLESLAPEAVARIEYDLKLGDDEASKKAAYEILDRTGFGRKDGGSLPGAPIIIVNNASDGTTTAYKPAFLQVDGQKK